LAKSYDFVLTTGADFIRDLWLKSGPDSDLRGSVIKCQLRHPTTNALLLTASTDLTATPLARLIAAYGVITLHIDDSVMIDKSTLPTGYVTEPVPSQDCPTTVHGPWCIYGLTIERFDGIVTELMRGKIGFRSLIAAV
jgi:hypothetical protein